MELNISWDEDFFGVKEKKPEKPKQQPYNVKVCEKEYFFKNPPPSDGLQKQNSIKFQADYWYQSGQYQKAFTAYKSIHDNPQVSSTTVERDIDESIVRCCIKLGNLSTALDFLSSLIKQYGEDTALLLLLADVCSRVKHILGEITCLKKCISHHPYNHNFWNSLAKAYSKIYQQTSNNIQENNMADISNSKIDEILQSFYSTKNYKDCLKLVVDCQHCSCTKGITLIDKELTCFDSRIQNGNAMHMAEHLNEETAVNSMEQLHIEENPPLSSMSSNENKSTSEIKSVAVHEVETNKDQISTTEEMPCLLTGKDQSSTCCSFNMTIMKLSDCDLQSTKCSQQDGLSLLTFFCLLRARFLLQRAIWTSMLFVKEKLCKTMAQVKEDIDNAVLCPCGRLKNCILKQIESEDSDLSTQQVEELDMHSLYQGNQKHWT